MEVFLELCVFLCLILIITSLYHLYYYSKSHNEGKTLQANLQYHENTNNNLYQKYSNAQQRHTNLRKVAANKLHLERNLTNENNRHAVAMSNVIPLQYNRMLAKGNIATPVLLKDHYNKLQVLRKNGLVQNQKMKENAYQLETSEEPLYHLPEISQTGTYIIEDECDIMDKDHLIMDKDHLIMDKDHLIMDNDHLIMDNDHRLLVGDECGDNHPYRHGVENDNVFDAYTIKLQLNRQDQGNCSCCGGRGGCSCCGGRGECSCCRGRGECSCCGVSNLSGGSGGSGGSGNTGGIGSSGHYNNFNVT